MMNEIIDGAVSNQKQQMTLLGAFAALALALASIGIYGVLSYTVALRRREIGVRMALGATASRVIQAVLRHGMRLTGAGLAIGITGAYVLTRLMSSMLFGVASTDPGIYASVAGILIGTALVACLIPAWRAAKVDPMVTLREE
jgi:ABC-type antimicrobial peptide transport system permease subunit